jgi:hypothetical protein
MKMHILSYNVWILNLENKVHKLRLYIQLGLTTKVDLFSYKNTSYKKARLPSKQDAWKEAH